MRRQGRESEFIRFLTADGPEKPPSERLPTLQEISRRLGVSVSRLREQMEVARVLGFVEVRPRTGIRRLRYSFAPAVWQSLSYAIALDRQHFLSFSDLRNHIEAAYWYQAVSCLTSDDHETLLKLVDQAWDRLRGTPVRIPHHEHRQLHLTLFQRLENPFVLGILEAYWDAYEAVGLNLYTDYHYLQQVWGYHQEMVAAICAGDLDRGFQALVEHKDLLYHRPDALPAGEQTRTAGGAPET